VFTLGDTSRLIGTTVAAVVSGRKAVALADNKCKFESGCFLLLAKKHLSTSTHPWCFCGV